MVIYQQISGLSSMWLNSTDYAKVMQMCVQPRPTKLLTKPKIVTILTRAMWWMTYLGFIHSQKKYRKKFCHFPIWKSPEKNFCWFVSMEKENNFLDLIFWHALYYYVLILLIKFWLMQFYFHHIEYHSACSSAYYWPRYFIKLHPL